MTTAQTAHRQILHLIRYFGTFSTKYQINTMLLALMRLSEFCYPFLDVVLFLIPCLYHWCRVIFVFASATEGKKVIISTYKKIVKCLKRQLQLREKFIKKVKQIIITKHLGPKLYTVFMSLDWKQWKNWNAIKIVCKCISSFSLTYKFQLPHY